MALRNLARAAMIGTAAMTLAATPASAQLVTFSTTGSFSGGSCISSFCAFGGYVLTWSGVNSTSWLPPADVSLGNFGLTCYGSGCLGGNILGGSTFMLTINQSGPNPGSGTISGSLGWDATSHTLSWTPDQSSVTIGNTTYGLTEDGTGCALHHDNPCIDINRPQGLFVTSFTTVHDDIVGGDGGGGDVTSTPEPATLALMATGLFGLVPVARLRRKK